MAKPVKLAKGKEFHFPTSRSGKASKYPWDEWFNPDPNKYASGLVMLEQSTGEKDEKGNVISVEDKLDYEVSTEQMVIKIKGAARKRYKVVQVSRHDVDGNLLDGAVIIKTRDMTEDEREAEDIYRAEKKAAKQEASEAA